MRLVPRLGLLCATLALPVGAALANHVLGEDSVPAAPAEVRIGESAGHQGGVGQPSAPPSPVAVRPLVVGEQSTPTQRQVEQGPIESASPNPMSEGVVPHAPPVADNTNGAAKGKAKGRNSAVPSHPTPPPSRGAGPGANGSGG